MLSRESQGGRDVKQDVRVGWMGVPTLNTHDHTVVSHMAANSFHPYLGLSDDPLEGK